jgi:hypothetical protein
VSNLEGGRVTTRGADVHVGIKDSSEHLVERLPRREQRSESNRRERVRGECRIDPPQVGRSSHHTAP